MKLIAFIAFIALITIAPLVAADKPAVPADPFAGAFFPPELVMQAHEQIGLTPEQEKTLQERMEKAQPASEKLRGKLELESAALATLVKQERVEESVVLAQLDKVLDAERELKHLHIGLAVAIKNLLTPEQLAKLREIAKDGGKQFTEATRQRLTEKVESVKAAMQRWADSGRDPSEIAQAMEQKFKPLIESGKITEAETELDRVIELLKADGK